MNFKRLFIFAFLALLFAAAVICYQARTIANQREAIEFLETPWKSGLDCQSIPGVRPI